MARFGEIITGKAVLVLFRTEAEKDCHSDMYEIARRFGDQAKCVSIVQEKNPVLFEALQIKYRPVFILYADEKEVQRFDFMYNKADIIGAIQKLIDKI